MAFNVYKMRLKPGSADDDATPFKFCKEKEIVGVGHEIYMDRTYENVENVEEAHWEYEAEHYDPDNRSRFRQDGELDSDLRYILKEIEEGDYIWVNKENTFGLCKVTGDWEVLPNLPEEERDKYMKNDIQNFRYVDWAIIPYFAVPGFVRRQFSGRFGTIARIRKPINDTTRALIERLFEQDDYHRQDEFLWTEIQTYVEETPADELINLLGPTATEDLVLLYLQEQGWKLVGSSLSNTQAKIECEMYRGDELSYVQVKSGNASVNPSNFENYDGTVFLFVGDDLNLESYEHIHQIDPDDVMAYLHKNIEEAPHDVLSGVQDVVEYE
ncbi:hypothetical protein [Halorussus lipolyticus]|uniref:hypothetical protein n=1 Tax=Halorussus lipolyticus TaxID=3034024 RepID=UPI0023E7A6C1|nr:hypothetical protein [Halorussus sp. DT80]